MNRRKFIKSSVGSAGLMMASSLLPTFAWDNNTKVFTVSFSGTACTRDEGELSRSGSNKDIYLPESGYVPVRINKELGGYTPTGGSGSREFGQTVRGVGENDWRLPRDDSSDLLITGPLTPSVSLRVDIHSYTSGNQLSTTEQLLGHSMPALALHGANLAAASGALEINMIGHSRGACECIMAAWFLYAYGDAAARKIKINIFAIDPVPGPGDWYGILTQLPPNVVNYVGIYSWDEVDGGERSGHPFQAVVPRPNGLMRGESNDITLYEPSYWDLSR